MLDKNPDRANITDVCRTSVEFSHAGPNIILATKPFQKAELAVTLVDSADCPVIFLDFDLLYSGYVTAGMVSRKDSIRLIRPQKWEWGRVLHSVLVQISQERSMVIIDSFNGLCRMYDGRQASRLANTSLMLLAHMGRFRKCQVVAMALARKSTKGRWMLSLGGRHITSSKTMRLYHLKKTDGILSVTLKHADHDLSNVIKTPL